MARWARSVCGRPGGGRVRIVWRLRVCFGRHAYGSRSGTGYAVLAVAYDDVVDVNLKVWGDEWEDSRSGRLKRRAARRPGNVAPCVGSPGLGARRRHPAREDRAAAASGGPSRRTSSSSCAHCSRAASFTSTSGMKVEDGPGAREDRGRGARRRSASMPRDREQIDDAIAHPWRTILLLLAARARDRPSGRSALVWFCLRPRAGTATTASTSRSRRPRHEPALVPHAARRRAATPGSLEFTATLFDLDPPGSATAPSR